MGGGLFCLLQQLFSSFSAIYSQSNGYLHQTWLFITSKLFQWNSLLPLKFMLSVCGCHTFRADNLCCSHFLIPTCRWTNLTSVFDILTHFMCASYSVFFLFFLHVQHIHHYVSTMNLFWAKFIPYCCCYLCLICCSLVDIVNNLSAVDSSFTPVFAVWLLSEIWKHFVSIKFFNMAVTERCPIERTLFFAKFRTFMDIGVNLFTVVVCAS